MEGDNAFQVYPDVAPPPAESEVITERHLAFFLYMDNVLIADKRRRLAVAALGSI